jgi:glutaredoxin
MGIFDRKPASAPQTAPAAGAPPPQYTQRTAPPQDSWNEDDDPFADAADAAKKAGGTRFPQIFSDGQCSHALVVDRIIGRRARLGGQSYLVECRVVWCSRPDIAAGTPRTFMELQSKEGWLSRVAKFIMAASGCTAADIDTPGVKSTFSPDQPFVGLMFMNDNSPSPDRKDASGQPFINTNFRAMNASEWARFAPMMQALDANWRPNALQPGAS